MNSPNPNNGKDNDNNNSPSLQNVKMKEEARVLKKFLKILSTNFDDDPTTIIESKKSPEYSGERSVIAALSSNGTLWGIGCGIASFAILRGVPWRVGRYFAGRKVGGGGGSTGGSGYRFDNVPGTNNPFPNSGTSGNASPPPRGIFRRGLGLAVDSFLSLWIGTASSYYMTDLGQIREELADMPLVEGRSMLSDRCCGEFIKEHKSIHKEFWNKNHDEFPSIISIDRFVQNCQKRNEYEKQLRSERGLAPGVPVAIPHPGVPRDFVVSEQLEGFTSEDDRGDRPSFEEGEDNANTGDFFYAEASFNDSDNQDEGGEQWDSFDNFEDKKEKGNGGNSSRGR